MGVPPSAQNLADELRLALQFVQCFCIGVPHSGQNFAPTVTADWQLPHAVVAAGAGAAGAAGGAGGAYPWPPPAKPGAGGGGGGGAAAGAGCIIWLAMPKPAPRNVGPTAAPPWAMPSPVPCSASAWAACRKPPASRE